MEEEIFEIEDFTCASDWEMFISNIEKRLREWRLHETHFRGANAEVKLESGGRKFLLQYICVSGTQTIFNGLDHTVRNVHFITQWFGVNVFLYLSSDEEPFREMNMCESEACQLLSSLSIAADCCRCCLPLFVPVGESAFVESKSLALPNVYGRMATPSGKLVRFDCRSCISTPTSLRHLSGLVDYFKDITKQQELISCILCTFNALSFRLGTPMALLYPLTLLR
jgi:hypothetical protein